MSDQLIRRAEIYRTYSAALYSALADDPFYITLENRVADRSKAKESMLTYYDYSIFEASRYGHVFQPEREPVGISVWSIPLNKEEAAKKNQQKMSVILSAMGDFCLQTYLDINDFMSESAEPLVSEKDWYLSIVGILPEFQGQGLGEDLVRPVLEKADDAGVSTYLETFTPKNMPFYQRLGYDAVSSFVEPVTNSQYWLMTRPSHQ
ncbi:MAG: GNAT family N-acetyltransferase [Rhodobacteraceae bacterium]|nr:GNAT family N-acetyltransferase [Paracoccaceae bacterium]